MENKQFQAIQDSLNSILDELKAIRILFTPKTPQEVEDELVDEVKTIILREGKASTAMLQRRLSIGYGRVSKILDILETKGIVGPYNGKKSRNVLIKK